MTSGPGTHSAEWPDQNASRPRRGRTGQHGALVPGRIRERSGRPTGRRGATRHGASGHSAEWVPRPPRLIGADLHDVATSTRVSLRNGRGPRAVFVIHSSDCGGCRAYIQRLVASADTFRQWDGLVSVVAYEPPEAAARVSTELPQLQVLSDLNATLGAGKAALLLADEWGEVYFAVQDVPDHELPSVADIIDWMRFIAIQCPECEQPESGWRSLE